MTAGEIFLTGGNCAAPHDHGRHAGFARMMRAAALCLGLLALAPFLAACDGGSSESLETRVDRARAAQAAGDLRGAVLELKNALRDHPQSGPARFFLGQIYLDLEDGDSAEKELSLAASYGVDRDAILLPLAQSWILQQKYDKVLDEVRISRNMQPHVQASFHVVHGDAWFGKADLDRARQSYETARDLDGTNALAHVGLGNVALARHEMEQAAAHLRDAEARDKSHPRVLTLEGDIAAARGDFKTALAAYSRLVEMRPQNVLYRTVLSWAQFNAGDPKSATANIRQVLQVAPDYPPANHIWSVIAYSTKDFQAAADAASKVVAIAPERIQSYLVLGAASYSLGRLEQAHAALSRYVAARPGDRDARKLLGNVQMALGRSADAFQTLAGMVDEKTTDAELLNLVAQAALQKGDLGTGREYLERSLALEQSPSVVSRLGFAQIALGRVDEGLAELERAVALDPKSFERRMVLAVQYLRAQRLDDALELARELQEANPKRAAGYVIEGLALTLSHKLPEAKRAFERGLEVEPGNPNAAHSLARMAALDEDWDKAEKILKSVLKVHKNEQRTLLLLADVAARKGDMEERLDYLARAIKAHPEAREPAIFYAQALLEQGEAAKAVDAINTVRPLFPDDAPLLEVAGRAELAAGRAVDAVITFERLLELQPESHLAAHLLGTAYEGEGNFVRAARAYERALKAAPESAETQFGLARVRLQLGQAAESRKLIDGLLARSDHELARPALLELRGHAALADKDAAAALKDFREVFELQKNSVNLRRVAETELVAGRPDDALRTLGKWLEAYPDDVDTRLQLANTLLVTGKLEPALREYEAVVAADKENAVAHNNLAWIAGELGQGDKALRHAGRAIALKPDVADFHDTAGSIYMKLKRADDAVAAFRRAADLAPQDGEIRHRLAEALAAAGRPQEAVTVLNDLLRGSYHLPDRAGAERMLLQLSNP